MIDEKQTRLLLDWVNKEIEKVESVIALDVTGKSRISDTAFAAALGAKHLLTRFGIRIHEAAGTV